MKRVAAPAKAGPLLREGEARLATEIAEGNEWRSRACKGGAAKVVAAATSKVLQAQAGGNMTCQHIRDLISGYLGSALPNACYWAFIASNPQRHLSVYIVPLIVCTGIPRHAMRLWRTASGFPHGA